MGGQGTVGRGSEDVTQRAAFTGVRGPAGDVTN